MAFQLLNNAHDFNLLRENGKIRVNYVHFVYCNHDSILFFFLLDKSYNKVLKTLVPRKTFLTSFIAPVVFSKFYRLYIQK